MPHDVLLRDSCSTAPFPKNYLLQMTDAEIRESVDDKMDSPGQDAAGDY
jgi:hypothetical protein